jgi:hypothetical protein
MRARTKVELVVAISFILILTSINVLSVTRTISDTNDTFDTYIRNSKGNYWAATGANIQTAIWDLNSTGGGTVYVPTGIFYRTTGLNLISGLNLIGMGNATVIKAASGFVDTYGLIRATQALYINNVTISDMTIDGNSTIKCICLKSVYDCTFQNLALNKGNSAGIYVSIGTRIIVSNVRMFNLKTYQGLDWTAATDSTINNLIIRNGTGAGNQAIDISTGCKNITVNNVEIFDTQLGIKVTNAENILMNNINIHDVRGDGFRVLNSNYSSFSNINIERITADNGFTIGASASSACKYINVNNVYIDSIDNIGFTIDYSSFVNVNNVNIKNSGTKGFNIGGGSNNCSISNVQASSSGSSSGYFSGTKNVKVVNSKFLKSTSYNLNLGGNTLLSFIGCDISYGSTDGVETADIGTANTNYSFINCNFIKNTKGMDIEGDSNITIMGCIFKDNSDDGIECNAKDSVIIMACIMWGDSFDDNIVGNHNVTGTNFNIGMNTI